MILSKPFSPRTQSSSPHPAYSELAPGPTVPQLLASPPATPPRGHKHSLSKPMSWLNRSSSSTFYLSAPHPAQKPTRISEPKMGSALDQLGLRRSGPLGSGATIVRTPQEALFGSSGEDGAKRDTLPPDTEKNESKVQQRQSSPPLPPLPGVPAPDAQGANRLSGNPESIALSDHVLPSRSSGSASPPARSTSSHPTLVAQSRAPSRSALTLSADTNLTQLPPQPPFEAILLSPIPDGAIEPSKLIVTLETCTTTYRFLLRSLVSRPSHLSRYITSLLSPAETVSMYSNVSDVSSSHLSNGFSTFFRDHLASSGCLPPSTSIHIFLDRPSAPYTHVLAYLRSPPSTPDHPETLPRAVQLGSMPSSRLESLLELRDEASYLGLAELEKLCSHEIQRSRRAALAVSASGVHCGQTGSVHSFHTAVERSPSRQEGPTRPYEFRPSKGNSISRRTAKTATRESSSGSTLERERSKQKRGIKHEVGSPPPGWI